jgi:hypothetical protein
MFVLRTGERQEDGEDSESTAGQDYRVEGWASCHLSGPFLRRDMKGTAKLCAVAVRSRRNEGTRARISDHGRVRVAMIVCCGGVFQEWSGSS